MIKKSTFLIIGLLISLITLNAQSWQQIGIDIDGEAADDGSGRSISLNADGTIVAIGAYGNDGNGTNAGHVRVYRNVSGTWSQIGVDIDGEAAGDYSGSSVSLSADGSILAIGAFNNDGTDTDAGHVRVYENVSDVWTQIGSDIDGEAAGDQSGFSVCLNTDGSIVAIGGIFNDGTATDAGHVRVYKNVSDVWIQVGADIDGEAAGDEFGFSLSLSADGSIIAVGSPYNGGTGTYAGHVRVFQNISDTWTQIGNDIDAEAAGDYFGYSLSLSSDGSIIAVGAPNNGGTGADAGHVRVFENISAVWTQIGSDIDSEAAGDQSGLSLSLNSDGSIVAIGAGSNDGTANLAGHLRVFENVSDTWTQIGNDMDGEAENDQSGNSVDINAAGTIVAIGAAYNNGTGADAGHVRVYKSPVARISNTLSNKFLIYPNPTSGKIIINREDIKIKNLWLKDILGKTVYTATDQSSNIQIDLSNLESGIYLIIIKTDEDIFTSKIVKR